MTTIRFRYKDPRTLNTLIQGVPEEGVALSTFLYPDIPEFLELMARTYHGVNFEELAPYLREEEKDGPSIIMVLGESAMVPLSTLSTEDLHKFKKYITKEEIFTLLMTQICREYGIAPFRGLEFRGDSSGKPSFTWEQPMGVYGWDESSCPEPLHTIHDPRHFTQNLKWYKISFKESRDVARAKEAISAFVGQGYRVMNIWAKLNPRGSVSDHYYWRETCDATLSAHDGVIDISGDNIPVDTTLQELLVDSGSNIDLGSVSGPKLLR